MKYTKVSNFTENRLYEILEDIEKFYYSDFWIKRYKQRLQEIELDFDPIILDIIQGTTTCIKEDNVFKTFDKDSSYRGISNSGTMIALNSHIDQDRLRNTIMHEFGHRQYNQKSFSEIVKLNSILIKSPSPIGLKSDLDLKYFTDKNEIRQRIIPIVKEMYDNNWTALEAYNNSSNLQNDDIIEIYDKDTILYWLDNIL